MTVKGLTLIQARRAGFILSELLGKSSVARTVLGNTDSDICTLLLRTMWGQSVWDLTTFFETMDVLRRGGVETQQILGTGSGCVVSAVKRPRSWHWVMSRS